MCALAWWVHRGWKMPVLLGAGLLFIINQAIGRRRPKA